MPHPWRHGLARRGVPLALAAVIGGVGWVFGTRVRAIREAEADLVRLRAQEAEVQEEILVLRGKLAAATLPPVVEREARLKLHWGYPDEERIVIVRR
ncbi:MAG: hypothetical protein Kow0097_09840 [Candidatus Bipolaricaulota bacterium]|nr:hypothetical protein [Candidatus Bipolaricaulota bacterium]